MFKYSVSQWIYGNESLEDTLFRLKKYGYDGIELAGNPALNIEETKLLLEKYKLECSSICGIFPADRDLASNDEEIRKNAIQYVKTLVDQAKGLGAPVVIVVPTTVGKHAPKTKEAWDHAVASLRVVGDYAQEENITLVVEALNRYETYLVTNLKDALAMVEDVNSPAVQVMADLFHMNLEERDNVKALASIQHSLAHVHIADNTREAAGLGQIDFASVLSYLKDIEYTGYLAMEFLPGRNKDAFTEQSIVHLKEIEKKI